MDGRSKVAIAGPAPIEGECGDASRRWRRTEQGGRAGLATRRVHSGKNDGLGSCQSEQRSREQSVVGWRRRWGSMTPAEVVLGEDASLVVAARLYWSTALATEKVAREFASGVKRKARSSRCAT